MASAVVVATLAGLAGWLGYRAYEKHEAQAQRDLFVQIARQGAVNLTTINYTEVDADVQRIIDLSTGAFRDDFRAAVQAVHRGRQGGAVEIGRHGHPMPGWNRSGATRLRCWWQSR